MKRTLAISIIVIAFSASLAQAVMYTRDTNDISQLPTDKVKLFEQKDEEVKAKYLEVNKRLGIAIIAMNNELLIEPFNEAKYLKKVAQVKEIEEEKFDYRYYAISELAEKFTAEQRKVLIGAFKERPGRNIKK